jgi:hypothetical protein
VRFQDGHRSAGRGGELREHVLERLARGIEREPRVGIEPAVDNDRQAGEFREPRRGLPQRKSRPARIDGRREGRLLRPALRGFVGDGRQRGAGEQREAASTAPLRRSTWGWQVLEHGCSREPSRPQAMH